MALGWIIVLGIVYLIIGAAVIRRLDEYCKIDAEDLYVGLVLIFPLVIFYVIIKSIGDWLEEII
jgi:hypothetical protein